MARRNHLAVFVSGACAAAGALVFFACGFDGIGTQVVPVIPDDSAPPLEASLPPTGDSAPDLDAGTDADAFVDAGPCPSGRPGPSMITVHDAGFCIDATEVTNGQYDQFLAATGGGKVDGGVVPSAPSPRCNGVTTWARRPPGGPDGGAPNLPVTRVSWCAAEAFCAWAGKRLCGGLDATRDPTSGEWYRACSNGEPGRTYPYGAAHKPGTCNDFGTLTSTVPVGSLASCEGGVGGLFDMSGNVEEWVDGCTDASDAGACAASGGYYGSGSDQSTCASREDVPIGSASERVGFRCCASGK